jgi:site-specific DNA-cytosine methylase
LVPVSRFLNTKYSILNTCKITGIPQNRERIYIVCFKDKTLYDNFNFDFPEIELKPVIQFLEKDIPEKYYYNDSTIILHDTIPLNKETSSREILKGSWTGDVFKMVLILKKYRPDLKLYNLEKSPGACIIKNLNPNSSVLKENYDKIVAEYMNLTFDDIAIDLKEQLSVLSFDKFEDIKKIL